MLVEAKRSRGEGPSVCAAVQAIRGSPVREILQRIGTAEDALTFWAMHLLLDARDVPPCLRWPRRDDPPQLVFLVWLADVYWFAKRNRDHKPFFRRWSGLFENEPGCEQWHKVALWVYRSGHRMAYYHSKGLGLSEADRQPLMTLISNSMRGDRAMLKRLPDFRDQIWLHATTHRDRSGKHSSNDIADRRAELLRLFLLAGRNRSRAVEHYERLSGQKLSRQAFTRHLDVIEEATGLRRLTSH